MKKLIFYFTFFLFTFLFTAISHAQTNEGISVNPAIIKIQDNTPQYIISITNKYNSEKSFTITVSPSSSLSPELQKRLDISKYIGIDNSNIKIKPLSTVKLTLTITPDIGHINSSLYGDLNIITQEPQESNVSAKIQHGFVVPIERDLLTQEDINNIKIKDVKIDHNLVDTSGNTNISFRIDNQSSNIYNVYGEYNVRDNEGSLVYHQEISSKNYIIFPNQSKIITSKFLQPEFLKSYTLEINLTNNNDYSITSITKSYYVISPFVFIFSLIIFLSLIVMTLNRKKIRKFLKKHIYTKIIRVKVYSKKINIKNYIVIIIMLLAIIISPISAQSLSGSTYKIPESDFTAGNKSQGSTYKINDELGGKLNGSSSVPQTGGSALSTYTIPTNIQYNFAKSTSCNLNTLAVTLPVNVTSSNLIVVSVFGSSTGQTNPISNVTDNKSNTYALITSKGDGSGDYLYMYYAYNVTGGSSFTITATATNTNSTTCIGIGANEYSGVKTSAPYDTSISTNGSVASGSSSTITTSSTSTTAAANELIVGSFIIASGSYSATAGSGFTLRQNNLPYLANEDRNVDTTGTYSSTLTFAGGGVGWAGITATFKTATGSSYPSSFYKMPIYVQSNQNKTSSNVTSLTVSFTNSVTTGDLIVVTAKVYQTSGNPNISTITDNKSNAYTQITSSSQSTTTKISMWYAYNVTGGSSFTITVNVPTAALTIEALEYGNMLGTSAVVDQYANNTSSSTTTSISSGNTPLTTQGNELIVGAVDNNSGLVDTITAGSGYTLRQTQPDDSTYESLMTEDTSTTLKASYVATASLTSLAVYEALVVTFKTAVSPSSSPDYIQSTNAASGGYTASSQSTVFPYAVSAGNLVVVAISSDKLTSLNNVTGVTDNEGNTYTLVVLTQPGSTEQYIYYSQNVQGGYNFTVTASTLSSTDIIVTATEYGNMATSNALDKYSNNTNCCNTVTSNSTSTTTSPNELLFGVISNGHANGTTYTITINSPYTTRLNLPDANVSIATADEFVTTTGTYAVTGTISTNTWSAAIATFKLYGGTGSGTYGITNGTTPLYYANIPTAPIVSNNNNTYYTQLNIILSNTGSPPGNNPTDTQFAVLVTSPSFTGTKYISSSNVLSSTLDNNNDWRVYSGGTSNWGGTSGITLTGLNYFTNYTFYVKARHRYTSTCSLSSCNIPASETPVVLLPSSNATPNTTASTASPTMSFNIQGVSAGGSTTVTSTSNSVSFGTISPGTPQIAGSTLQVTTNALHGYSVKMNANQKLTSGTSTIDWFAGSSASYTTPQLWTAPTGTSSNAGWIGYNTSDTSESQFQSGGTKFAPFALSPSSDIVSTSSSAQTNTTINTSMLYEIQVDSYQQGGVYNGMTITYTLTGFF